MYFRFNVDHRFRTSRCPHPRALRFEERASGRRCDGIDLLVEGLQCHGLAGLADAVPGLVATGASKKILRFVAACWSERSISPCLSVL